jgi:hypothetical protein
VIPSKLEIIRLSVAARAIVDAIARLDERHLVAMVGVGVSAQDDPEEQANPAIGKSSRIILKRLELLLRFKRELATIEELTTAEVEQAMDARFAKLLGLFEAAEVKR